MNAELFIMFLGSTQGDELAPISLDEAKAHLRIDSADQDVLIGDYVRAAAALIEGASGIVCRARSLTARYPGFSARLPLRRSPVNSVTGIQYVDPNGMLQTLDSSQYVLTEFCGAPCIEPAVNVSWPATAAGGSSVIVSFNAGYASNGLADATVRTAARLIVGNFWINRDGSGGMPPLADSMLSNVSVVDIG